MFIPHLAGAVLVIPLDHSGSTALTQPALSGEPRVIRAIQVIRVMRVIGVKRGSFRAATNTLSVTVTMP